RQKIGCKKCYHNKRKLTFKDIENRLKNETNNEYQLISIGSTVTDKIKIRHNCGYEYDVDFGSFFYSGKRCRKCYGTAAISKEEFLDFFNNEMEGYELISNFSKMRDRITIKHLKCGKIYSVEPRSIKNQNARCICEKSSVGERQIRKILKNKNIDFEEQYKIPNCKNILPLPFDFKVTINDKEIGKMRDRITIKHLKCCKIYSVEPRSIKNQNARCLCEKSSVGERQIRKILKNKNIDFEEQFKIPNCKNILPLPFDFKITINDK